AACATGPTALARGLAQATQSPAGQGQTFLSSSPSWLLRSSWHTGVCLCRLAMQTLGHHRPVWTIESGRRDTAAGWASRNRVVLSYPHGMEQFLSLPDVTKEAPSRTYCAVR